MPQYYKSPGCHAERERSICFYDTLQKADSSPAAQNDMATQSLCELVDLDLAKEARAEHGG
jgi:hypothetical protein